MNPLESVTEVIVTVKAHRGNHQVETERRVEIMIHILKETMIEINAETEIETPGEDELRLISYH